MYIQTPGYILRSMNWREGDRLYIIFTRELGKVEAQARGARKIQSKLAGHLQPFRSVNLHLARGKVFCHVIGAQSGNSGYLAQNGRVFGYAQYFLELVDRMTKVGQKSDDIFRLLEDVFDILENTKDFERLKRLRIVFLLKLLKATGFNPERRVARDNKTRKELFVYLNCPLKEVDFTENNGTLKTLFGISQYGLNEVIERPLNSAKYLQSFG